MASLLQVVRIKRYVYGSKVILRENSLVIPILSGNSQKSQALALPHALMMKPSSSGPLMDSNSMK